MSNMQDMPNFIVSVESRKGGVGKTTAALCMARLLRRKGYTVLVLDLDVTGTNAADIAGSPFWVRDLHIIKEVNKKSNANAPLNLIRLFDQCFMAGMAIPDFSEQATDTEALRIDLSMVNVLGSQIYNDGQDQDKGATSIERPGIFFDDLHTIWLLELVQQIIGNFVRVSRNDPSAKQAIILDNSPGYVGIAPAIHDWLTDCGPERGKFLTVTSLDAQDLRACDIAIEALHGMYTSKWQTSRLFLNGGKKGSGVNVSQKQETFFMRLASSSLGSSGANDPLTFYKSVELASRQHNHKKGGIFCDHPDKYIAAIINRVPRAVKAGRLVYDYEFPTVLSEGRRAINRLLGGDDEKHDWRERMISYDEYIENQFLLQWLQRGRRHNERRVHRLIEILEIADNDLRVGTNEYGDDPVMLLEMADEFHDRLKLQLIRTNEIVSHARLAVADAGLGHLSRLIHDEWLPGSIIPSFRDTFSRFLSESEFPFFEMMPYEIDTGPVNQEARNFMASLKGQILSEMRNYIMGAREYEDNQIIEKLSAILSGFVGLSLTSPLWHSPLKEEISGLFGFILFIELMHWSKRREEKSRYFSIQRFLAQESISQVEINEFEQRFMPHRFFRQHMMRDGGISFVELYKACTSAQARLIDYAKDSRFLIHLLRFIAKGEIERGNLFPFVRDIAEDVIVKKILSHEDAPIKMAKALQTAEYFKEFDRVINEILTVWGVTHE